MYFRTTGSEVGAPRDLSAIKTMPTSIQLTWLPPQPEGPNIVAYKVQYSPRGDSSKPVETVLSGEELSCSGFESPVLTGESVCTEVKGLKPKTNYRFKVQAQAPSGNWGPWSPEVYATTKSEDAGPVDLGWLGPPTDLRLLDKSDSMLYVDWIHPDVFEPKYRDLLTHYRVTIAPLDANNNWRPGKETNYTVNYPENTMRFHELRPETPYNISGWRS